MDYSWGWARLWIWLSNCRAAWLDPEGGWARVEAISRCPSYRRGRCLIFPYPSLQHPYHLIARMRAAITINNIDLSLRMRTHRLHPSHEGLRHSHDSLLGLLDDHRNVALRSTDFVVALAIYTFVHI